MSSYTYSYFYSFFYSPFSFLFFLSIFSFSPFSFFFFFNDTATTEIYTLSLHDALPICVDFGIAGLDAVEERRGENGQIMILHEALRFGHCALALAVPEDWPVHCVADLEAYAPTLGHPLRVATQYPAVAGRFLKANGIKAAKLIQAEGTLEVAPSIGYADAIADLVSSGQTLRDNRLRVLEDGVILRSQAVFFANRKALKDRPEVLALAHQLLEYIEAYLRGQENYMIVANMRGSSAEAIAQAMFQQPE